MQPQRDGLENLDKLRAALEKNIQQLRKSLAYWQLWEAEYEGLKETLETLEDGSSPNDMLAVGVDMGGDVVNEAEIKSLIWPTKGITRTKTQIISNINGRIDTGAKNAVTVRKQLHTAEGKLEQVLFVSQPTAKTEEGLPVMTITEELDDEDNIISSNVKREDEHLGRDMDKYMAVLSNKEGKQPAASLVVGDKGKAPASGQSSQTTTPSSGMARTPSIGKKVSFAKEPEINVIPSRESNVPTSSTPKSNIVDHAGVARTHPTEHMLILDDNDYVIGSEPLEVVDTSKLALEARDNMNGIGAIVASMTIDNMSDDEDYDYDEYESEELDDVDWRTLDRAPVGADLADDSYKSYIEELMKKHEAAFENVGPRHDVSILESLASEPDTAASKLDLSKSNSEAKQGKDMSRQKGVRFAEELDIQAAPARPKNLSAMSEPSQTPLSENALERDAPKKPLVDSVIERTSISRPAANTPLEPPQPRKVSRFKAARSGG